MEIQRPSSTLRPVTLPALRPARWRWPQLPFNFSERRLLLGALDLAMMDSALAGSLWLRFGPTPMPASLERVFVWYALLGGLWLVFANLFNLYDLAVASRPANSVGGAAAAALLTAFVYTIIPHWTSAFPERRLDFFVFLALASAGVSAWRLAYAQLLSQPLFFERVLIVGAGAAGATLAGLLAGQGDASGKRFPGSGYKALGFIDDDPHKLGTLVRGIPIVGNRHDLVRIVRSLKPDSLVIAITDYQNVYPELFQAILDCQELGVSVVSMTAVYESLTGRIPVEHAGRNLNVPLPISSPAKFRSYFALRRVGESAVCFILAVPLAFLVPLVWLANRLSSPGSLFYFQERVGKGGRRFRLVKFRSMGLDAERHGAVWAAENDLRVTPIGKLLRKTRLDELPQTWNVLKGDMSLIGPRPERPEFVAQLAKDIRFYRLRHAVKPGITGWAQVNYRYGSSARDALVKLQYDLYYIKHQGPYLDLLILLRTIQVVLGLRGR